MPDTQFIAVILLLAAAVAFGYFYLKRAQGRDHPVTSTRVDHDDAPAPPAATTDGETVRTAADDRR